MDFSTFRFTAYGLLLVFFLSQWRGTDCQGLTTAGTTISVTTQSITQSITQSTTQSTKTVNSPEDVTKVTVTQTETTVTIEFDKVVGVDTYNLSYVINGTVKSAYIAWAGDSPAKRIVSGLMPAQIYYMTLRSISGGLQSSGYSFNAITAPGNVEKLTAVDQNESSITIEWTKKTGILLYILKFGGNEKNLTEEDSRKYVVPDLMSGTEYNFTLYSVFEGIRSTGVNLTAVTAPRKPERFGPVYQSETSITLQWEPVPGVTEYILRYNNIDSRIPETNETTVPGLTSGTWFNFTLFAEFKSVRSIGAQITAATVPPQVSVVEVTERTLTTLTLQWESVRKDWNYHVVFSDSANSTLIRDGDFVSYFARSLKPGTVYPFSIVTEFATLNSTPFKNKTVTVIDCTIVDWKVTETSIQGKVNGAFTDATASNGSQSHPNSGSGDEMKFTGLYPGATYNMTLLYKGLEQCNHSLTTIPPPLTASCKNWDAGYSIYIEWDRPSGVWDSVEVNVSDKVHKVGYNELFAEISNFQPAKTYKVSIGSLSGPQRSTPSVFTCATDARGVIAGAFFGVLLFLVLVCVVVFVMLRRTDIISKHKKSLPGASRTSVKKHKWIPLDRFPYLFTELSADENKGFSLEYEDLAVVGTEQSQKAATMQENKPKNRFINVLPYDHSRVKLTSSSPHKDYINASYIPGYNSKREFIAAQGPLPSTVSDFWRMIWEQKASGIVMVTNCTEAGRTKCEQYWPDGNAHVGGDLEVFTASEQKEPDWTLREFKVKHRHTSEERTVRHFHFTAWPDHGVPQGTQVLIQFRALVRRHMRTEAKGAPTVVHCSAGVGRTGTIIALDVLLQQMEKEKAVDINGFVHEMRLNRPHMVQTESQYVFLHQCILDSLLLNEKYEENIYENELIYANATALRDFENMNKA